MGQVPYDLVGLFLISCFEKTQNHVEKSFAVVDGAKSNVAEVSGFTFNFIQNSLLDRRVTIAVVV